MNRQAAASHLRMLAERIFRLPDALGLEIRQVTIRREDLSDPAAGERLIARAVDACWHDAYSDIDMTVLLRERPHDPLAWLSCIGVDEAHCLGFFVAQDSGACRVVFRDGFRYDISLAEDTGHQAKAVVSPEEPCWPREAVNRFWFVQVQALGKLYRQDYLIARHLAHMQLNETLVQQMVLRDLRLGTNHHRYGAKEEAVYQRYAGMCPVRTGEAAFDEIAEALYCAARAYDELLAVLDPDAVPRTPDFWNLWQRYEQHRQDGR